MLQLQLFACSEMTNKQIIGKFNNTNKVEKSVNSLKFITETQNIN